MGRSHSLKPLLCTLVISLSLLSGRTLEAQHAFVVGTSGQGTMTYSVGSAVAGLLSERGLRSVVQPQAGTAIALALINLGELDLGFASAIEVQQAFAGEGQFGRANPDLRIVGRLFTTRVGLLTRRSASIERISELRGRTIAYGFSSVPHIQNTIDAMLANGGLTMEDVRPVRVPNLVRGADELAAGTVDATTFALGSAKVSEIDASTGGIRYLPLIDTAAAAARMQSILPLTYLVKVEPAPALAGIEAPMTVMGYDYVVLAATHVPDDLVYRLTQVLSENQPYLAGSFAGLREFDPQRMAEGDYGVPMHSGAARYYRETGILEHE